MDNKSLRILKEKYNKELTIKNKFEKVLEVLNKRKEIMENSPVVRDYIDLMKQIEECKLQILSVDETLIGLIHSLGIKRSDTNKILCFMGTFIQENGGIQLVNRDYHLAEFDRYMDIESLSVIDNPVEDRNRFESENLIIYSDNPYRLHDEFISDCIESDQDTALSNMLVRCRKNNK